MLKDHLSNCAACRSGFPCAEAVALLRAVAAPTGNCDSCTLPWRPFFHHTMDADGQVWTRVENPDCPCAAWLKLE